MSPAPAPLAPPMQPSSTAASLDEALLSGDSDALHALGYPSPLAILSGDIVGVLKSSAALSHPLNAALSALLNNHALPASADTYVATVVALNAFLRSNFAGPLLADGRDALSPSSPPDLAVDGEDAAAAVHDAHLLVAAEANLAAHAGAYAAQGLTAAHWWAARAAIAHTAVIGRPTSTLRHRVLSAFATFLGTPSTAHAAAADAGGDDALGGSCRFGPGLRALASLELCAAQQTFYDGEGATRSLEAACGMLGIRVDVRGFLGVRTKFQRTPVSQLVARVFAAEREVNHAARPAVVCDFPRKESEGVFSLPQNVPLDDSDLLGYVRLTPLESGGDGEEQGDTLDVGEEIVDVTPVEQAALLAHATVEMARNASHGITESQAAPYVTRILSAVESEHGSSSVVQLRALLLRTHFERDRGRFMERNMAQMETVSKFVDFKVGLLQYEETESQHKAALERLALLFASGLPPRWELKKELAIAFGRLGLVKSAMEIFEELEFWDELVDCHRLVGNIGAAEELVRTRLAQLDDAVTEADDEADVSLAKDMLKRQRPRLLCVLGDVTRDANCFEIAWSESGKRYGRAKRSLGRFAAEREEWEEAIDHFRDSLKLNSLQPEIWFTCGCAAIKIGNLELAAQSFTHVVQETPDNAEAWNNLGRALCEIGRQKEGLSALLQAAKYRRESWRIWGNVLRTATELKASSEIVLAMSQLIELKGREAISAAPLLVAVDEVIRIASSPSEPEPGSDGPAVTPEDRASASSTCKALLKLLARATTLMSSDPSIWAAYARLHELAPGVESRRKSADCRQRQIRTLISQRQWKSEASEFRAMAVASLAFAKAAADSQDGHLIHAAKLHITSIMSQSEDSFGMSDAFELLREAKFELDS